MTITVNLTTVTVFTRLQRCILYTGGGAKLQTIWIRLGLVTLLQSRSSFLGTKSVGIVWCTRHIAIGVAFPSVFDFLWCVIVRLTHLI